MNAKLINNVRDLKQAKGFKIVQINCRSILNKIVEIRYLYDDVDILICTETWLTDKIPDHMIEIAEMDLFRWDRQNGYARGVTKSRGGGVACYVNKRLHLDCHVLVDLTLTTSDIELLTLRCVYSYGKITHVMSLYRPPEGSIDAFFEILSGITEQLPEKELWILGDFNIDFLKRTDPKTKKLIEFLRINSLRQHINGPTRLTGFSRSCIDLAISNVPINLIVSSGTLVDIISDHMPIYICIKKQRNTAKFQKIKGRTYRNYNKDILQALITNDNWDRFFELYNPTDLWNFILKIIENHVNVMCPIKFMRIRTNSPPWITQDVIEAINDRNSLYTQFKNTRNPIDLSLARRARNRVNKLMQFSKAGYIKETLNQHKDDPKKFWRVLNENLLKGEMRSSDITFNKGNDEYTNIDDSCEFMNSHFAGIGKKLYEQFNTDLLLENYTCMYNLDNSDEEIVFTVEDIVKIVKDINVHKSSGIEYMPSFILKDVFEVIPLQLTYLFNQSMALGLFPESWAVATVTPIPKVGNIHIATNWRPISIIPLIGKIMEKLCNSLLNRHLELQHLLCDEQYGFRSKRSTSIAIFNYLKNIINDINNRKIVGAMYMDFSKAFDSINHGKLKNKLKDMGVPLKLLTWISSYLENRKIKTKLNNCISSTAELICGVPQGSVLGPTLFLCYINDLALITKELGMSISLYADDAVIYCSNHDSYFVKERLEAALSRVIEWCNRNYININIDKTKFCIYGTRVNVSKFTDNNLNSEDRKIQRCQQYQYLGVFLDECLTMKSNFNSVFKKFSYKIYQFGKIRKFLDIETRVLVYKQTVLPLTEYVNFVMCLNNKQETDKLQKLQNKALRMCYNIQIPRDMRIGRLHEMANVDMLHKRRMLHLLGILYDNIQNYRQDRVITHNTRLAEKNNLVISRANTELYAKSPYCIGGTIWNDLPKHIQEQKTKDRFKCAIKDLI